MVVTPLVTILTRVDTTLAALPITKTSFIGLLAVLVAGTGLPTILGSGINRRERAVGGELGVILDNKRE